MKLFHFIVLYFLIVSVQTYGQSESQLIHYSDSLYKTLKQLEDREEKAVALLDLSFYWSDYDTIKAFHYISEAKDVLGTKSKGDYYKGLVAFYTASVYFDQEPDKAKKMYMEADSLLQHVDTNQKSNAIRYRARLWGSYGALLQREGKAKDYVAILLDKVIPLAKQTGDNILLGNNYQNVAINLMNMQEYAKADVHYYKAMALLRDKKDAQEERLTLYVNAARNALFAKNYTQSESMLDTASVIAKSIPNSTYIPMYHTVAGSYYASAKQFNKAHEHLAKGLASAKRLKNEEYIATLIYDQFKAYQQNGQYHEAKSKLMEVLPYIEQTPSLANKQMVYYNLAKTSSELYQYQEAVKWYEAYKLISDSILESSNRQQILELEHKYQTIEKERELLKIKSQHQEQSLALQKAHTITMISASVCILLFLLGFIWYRAQQNKKRLSAQKEQLLKEELKSHQQETKLSLYNAMLQGEERERIRLARDLHDGLGGMLANVKMKLSAVTDYLDKQQMDLSITANLQSIIHQHDQSVHELRRISRNLMPEALLYRSLKDALQDLCKSMSQPNISIDFQSAALKENYGQPFLISVYRIVQELVTNALKHSEADQVWVQCTEENDMLYIAIEDNGKGFEQSGKISNHSGIGLKNIRNRIALLNGHLEIDTSPGKGSSFHIQLPTHE